MSLFSFCPCRYFINLSFGCLKIDFFWLMELLRTFIYLQSLFDISCSFTETWFHEILLIESSGHVFARYTYFFWGNVYLSYQFLLLTLVWRGLSMVVDLSHVESRIFPHAFCTLHSRVLIPWIICIWWHTCLIYEHLIAVSILRFFYYIDHIELPFILVLNCARQLISLVRHGCLCSFFWVQLVLRN